MDPVGDDREPGRLHAAACQQDDGVFVVDGPTSGDLPGIPFTFRFTLENAAIAALEIY